VKFFKSPTGITKVTLTNDKLKFLRRGKQNYPKNRKVGVFTEKASRNLHNRLSRAKFDYPKSRAVTLPFPHDVENYPQEIKTLLDKLKRRIRKIAPKMFGYCVREWYPGTDTPHFHGILQPNTPDPDSTLSEIFEYWRELSGCAPKHCYCEKVDSPGGWVRYLAKQKTTKNPVSNLKGLGRCWFKLGKRPPEVNEKVFKLRSNDLAIVKAAALAQCSTTGRSRTALKLKEDQFSSVSMLLSQPEKRDLSRAIEQATGRSRRRLQKLAMALDGVRPRRATHFLVLSPSTAICPTRPFLRRKFASPVRVRCPPRLLRADQQFLASIQLGISR